MSTPTFIRAANAATPDAPRPTELFKVELDERCLLFPDGKPLQHVLIGANPAGLIELDAVFFFNRSRLDPRIASFKLAEARDFAAELVNAVYAAKTSFALADEMRIAINVISNGYRIEFTRAERMVELFLSTGSIWRFIRGLLMAIDALTPSAAN